MKLRVGQESQLEWRVSDDSGELPEVPSRVTSDHPEVVSVSDEGLVKAVGSGEATIKVLAAGQEALVMVNVR